LPELLKLTNRKEEILKLIKFDSKLNGNSKIDTNYIKDIVEILSLNASILNDDVKIVITTLIKETEDRMNLKDKFSNLVLDLKTFEDNENHQIFMKFKNEIIDTLIEIINTLY